MKDILKFAGLDFRIINPKLISETSYWKFYNNKKFLEYSCELEKKTGLLFSNEIFKDEINSVAVFFIPYLSFDNSTQSGNISKYAMGKDYHLRGKEIFESIIQKLQENYSENKFYYQCDIGEINERFYAGASGLCTIGKNGNLIHKEFGSYGNLALVYSDLESEEYKTDVKVCLNCNKCKDACPANAIKDNGVNNSKTCISFLTQKKSELTEKEIILIRDSGYIFGCDICQMVCPLNQQIEFVNKKDDICALDTINIKNMSNREFKEKYKESAFSWRGKAVLQRNINIVYNK